MEQRAEQQLKERALLVLDQRDQHKLDAWQMDELALQVFEERNDGLEVEQVEKRKAEVANDRENLVEGLPDLESDLTHHVEE